MEELPLLLKTTKKRKRTKEELEKEALSEDRQAYLQDVKRLKLEHAQMLQTLQAI